MSITEKYRVAYIDFLFAICWVGGGGGGLGVLTSRQMFRHSSVYQKTFMSASNACMRYKPLLADCRLIAFPLSILTAA